MRDYARIIRCGLVLDLVSGEPRDAAAIRYDESQCGKDGKWFENRLGIVKPDTPAPGLKADELSAISANMGQLFAGRVHLPTETDGEDWKEPRDEHGYRK
jgi:hypothetical protein